MNEVRADWARYIPTGEYINVDQAQPPPTVVNSENQLRQRPVRKSKLYHEAESKKMPSFLSMPQIIIMLGLVEMFIAGGFQFNDGKDDHKMMLYSAFFSYDELINCAIAGVAFLAGVTALLGSFSSFMAVIHALFGMLVGGACFLACCVSVFSTLVTLCNGLPVSVVDSMVANFASSVRQVLASKTQPNHVMADITESLVCVIASNVINALTNALLSLLLLSSAVACFVNRGQLEAKKSSTTRHNLVDDPEIY